MPLTRDLRRSRKRRRRQWSPTAPVTPVYLVYSGAATVNVPFTVTASVDAGDAIVVLPNTSAGVTGITDSAGNTYVVVSNRSANGAAMFAATYKGSPSMSTAPLVAGTGTITLAGSGTAATVVGVRGAASIAPDSAPAFNSGSGANPSGPATGVMGQPGDIIIASFMGGTGVIVTAWNGGFNQVTATFQGAAHTYVAYLVSSDTSSVTPSAVAVAGNWTGFTVALAPVPITNPAKMPPAQSWPTVHRSSYW